MTPSPRYPCPGCSRPVRYADLSCAHCHASLLYGLIAAPVADAATVEKAAAILAGVAGGPDLAEARGRLQRGQPLVVGLSRERSEQVQGRLVELGLVPRLGPAPKGTAPLGHRERGSEVWGRVVLAALLPAFAVAGYWALDRYRADQAALTEAEAPLPPGDAPQAVESRRIQVTATVERSRFGKMTLVGVVQVVSPDALPQGDLDLVISDRRGSALWLRSVDGGSGSSRAATGPGTPANRVLRFRESLHELNLQGGEQLRLEAEWGGWRIDPLPLQAPRAPPR